jgi:2'-5' RNA ligase
MAESFILVAIPSDSVRSLAEYLCANIQQKYQLYGTVIPPFHFAVELIRPTNSEEMRQAIQTIQSVTATFPPFDLTVRGYHFFGPPYLAITLAVERSRVIERLSRTLFDELSNQGIPIRDDYNKWMFHITVASIHGAIHPWSETEFREATRWVSEIPAKASCRVEELQLWGPQYAPELDVRAIFHLADSQTSSG